MSGLQALSCRRQDERSAKPEGHVPQGMPYPNPNPNPNQ